VGLDRAAGFLRSSLAHRLSTRTVPELHFAYDESIERGVRLSKLIDDALAPAAPAKARRPRGGASR
jgi:ribosome-binding factor A